MKKDNYDIVIIGAGLAGVTCALTASRQSGLKIALVERETIGSNKSVPLTFADVTDENDLLDCIKGRYSSFAFHNYRGSKIEYVFSDHPLVVLDYQKACSKIFQNISRVENRFEYIIGYAKRIYSVGKDLCVPVSDERNLTAKIVIDCTGGNSTANDEEVIASRYFSHPFGAIFSGVQLIRDKIAYFLLPNNEFGNGGGWFYPLEDNRVSFGYATISNSITLDVAEVRRKFFRAVNEFEPYCHILKSAKLESIDRGIIPITYKKNLTRQNIMYVGDAAGMATNWTPT